MEKKEFEAYLDHRSIFLKKNGSDTIFTPLTAVYWFLTGKEIHRGSFWCEEMEKDFGMHWWEIVEINYSNMALGSNYNRELRNKLLAISGLPLDKF